MKKILIFSFAYLPKNIGGAEVAVKEKTDRIGDIEFHMVTNRFDSTLPKVEKIGNVLVHRIGITAKNPTVEDLKKFPLNLNKPLFQFYAAWKALQLHRIYHYDAVWAIMAHSCGVPAALFKLIRPRTPFILELQEGDTPAYIEHKMRPVWPLFSRAFTSADVVSVISTFLGRWARTRGFTGPLELVPNAVDTKQFGKEHGPGELSLQGLKKKDGDIFIVTTSRLVHKNAVDEVIRALVYLPHNFYFLVLGVGPDEQMLKTLSTTLGVADRVRWLGHIEHRGILNYLKISDMFVRPSRSEGMGVSFVEAMAAGLPVIATQEGGIADFLFDAKHNPDKPTTGWAVDKDSPKQIAEAVEEIVRNQENTKRVIKNAQNLVAEKYDWDLIAKNMREQVFGRVLKSS